MGITENERQVWHGTSGLDPAMIYNDKQDGFMMQFAAAGFWGRGIYFADKSAYSCNYSYTPDGTTVPERGTAQTGEKEMFLAKLLIGNSIMMDRDLSHAKATECRNLIVPPIDPGMFRESPDCYSRCHALFRAAAMMH
jgi:hypothetical protein